MSNPPAADRSPAGLRYPTPDEAAALARLDQLRADLQALQANLMSLPNRPDLADAGRSLRTAQRCLVHAAEALARPLQRLS